MVETTAYCTERQKFCQPNFSSLVNRVKSFYCAGRVARKLAGARDHHPIDLSTAIVHCVPLPGLSCLGLHVILQGWAVDCTGHLCGSQRALVLDGL
jgi:hypothetical protein